MPKSKSKRKKSAGRGRNRRMLYVPFPIMRYFPMWDDDMRALELDIEVHYRALRDGTASKEDLETAACTLAARFESSALIAERVVDKGRIYAEALRVGISKIYDAYQAYLADKTPDASLWPGIEQGVSAVQAVESLATRSELRGAYRAVMARMQKVENEASEKRATITP